MKRAQQISPWSIYHQQGQEDPFAPEQDPEKTIYKLPKVNHNKSAKSVLPKVASPLKKRRAQVMDSVASRMQHLQGKLQRPMTPEITEKQLLQMQEDVGKRYEEKLVLSIIYHQLKAAQLLISQQEERERVQFQRELQRERELEFKQLILIKKPKPKEKQTILPKITPKIRGYHSCVISKCPIGLEEAKEPDDTTEMMNRILKQKIEDLISDKMKILNKKKQSIGKDSNKPYNFY